MEIREIVITCLPKLGWAVAEELEDLRFPVIEIGHQSVKTKGTMEDCMQLNLLLRCANRVLFLIDSFTAVHPDRLYKQVKKLPWEKWIDPKGYVSISSFVKNDNIRDNRFANLRVKDAIVDRMLSETGQRPDSGPELDGTVIFLHWVENECSIYFDTSGETISKHGYRKYPHKAPLHESLAASIIRATQWDGKGIFVNPMCGSGTLAIEAALMLYNIHPAIWRKNYSFMHVNPYNYEAWASIKNQHSPKIPGKPLTKIIATDISGYALDAARNNARAAGVDHLIEFHKCSFERTIIPPNDGLVILNPEYGQRMGEEEELEVTYKEIGDFFKQKCPGKTGFIFTGNLELAKKVGLKAKRRFEFMNAKLDCRLLKYELYSGSARSPDITQVE